MSPVLCERRSLLLGLGLFLFDTLVRRLSVAQVAAVILVAYALSVLL